MNERQPNLGKICQNCNLYPCVCGYSLESLDIAEAYFDEQLIIGAGGNSKKIFIWDMRGNLRKSIDVVINNESKFASCVRVFFREGVPYVAIGTSSGILIKSVIDKGIAKELLIRAPDGSNGHIRGIELIDDFLVCSNYHIMPDQQSGFGLFEIDLNGAFNSRKNQFYMNNIFNDLTGSIRKTSFVGEEILVFASRNRLILYNPIQNRKSDLYISNDDNAFITAISNDCRIIGDSKGYLTFLSKDFQENDRIFTTFHAITALTRFTSVEDHLFVGNSYSYFMHYKLRDRGVDKSLSRSMGIANVLTKTAIKNEIHAVKDIKAFSVEGESWVFVACEKELISFQLKDLMSTDKALFKRRIRSFDSAEEAHHTIFSIDILERDSKK